MGQEEIIKFLKANPDEWFSSQEISKEINISLGAVITCLKILRENNEMEYKTSGTGGRYQYLYKFKK